MTKHYAIYRDGLLLIRTKTLAKAERIIKEHMALGLSSKLRSSYDIRPELWMPEPAVRS